MNNQSSRFSTRNLSQAINSYTDYFTFFQRSKSLTTSWDITKWVTIHQQQSTAEVWSGRGNRMITREYREAVGTSVILVRICMGSYLVDIGLYGVA